MKTALITGATDGIGKATAKKLLAEGWKVVILGRNPQKCKDTISELMKISKDVSVIVCDLSILKEVNKAVDTFLSENTRLDLLLLNANAIANERIITQEGNEQNFAIGYLSRVLMIERFLDILEETPNAQILSVVGMDYSRIDFEDLTIEKDFTGRKGLTRWQWAMNVFTREYKNSVNNTVPLNLYMPGLVKTKILANEPQPGRTFVKIMNMIVGISVEKAAENIFSVINEITNKHKNGTCYSWKTERSFPKVEMKDGDTKRLLEVTDKLLTPFV
jgi:NAD(P)-dependent dehydrogenase (short-subunit alcohol dehydrogenase family)